MMCLFSLLFCVGRFSFVSTRSQFPTFSLDSMIRLLTIDATSFLSAILCVFLDVLFNALELVVLEVSMFTRSDHYLSINCDVPLLAIQRDPHKRYSMFLVQAILDVSHAFVVDNLSSASIAGDTLIFL